MAQPASQHALVFRIMRLSRPSLSVEDTLRFDMQRDFVSDAATTSGAQPQLASALPASSYPFAGRVQLDGGGGSGGAQGGPLGPLALPQSFGLVYLGETFQAYVTVANYSEQTVSNVAVKVELQTEGSKAVLHDNTPSPVPSLRPGQRHDFLIKHDIKELGPHTLACSSLYTALDGERKYLPQHFRFASANPMVVRTRHRLVGYSVFLEATLENATRGPLVMELVSFQPRAPYSARQLGEELLGPAAAADGPLGQAGLLGSGPVVPEGGSLSYLFQLTKPPLVQLEGHPPAARDTLTNPAQAVIGLGRLEIRWRGHMGQAARLQTQAITMPSPQPPRDLLLQLDGLPHRVVAEQPFSLELSVHNATDRRLGPLRLGLESGGAAAGAGEGAGGLLLGQGVVLEGPQSVAIDEVPPRGAVKVALPLVALAPGQQALQGLSLRGERDGKQYDTLPRQDLFVLPACA